MMEINHIFDDLIRYDFLYISSIICSFLFFRVIVKMKGWKLFLSQVSVILLFMIAFQQIKQDEFIKQVIPEVENHLNIDLKEYTIRYDKNISELRSLYKGDSICLLVFPEIKTKSSMNESNDRPLENESLISIDEKQSDGSDGNSSATNKSQEFDDIKDTVDKANIYSILIENKDNYLSFYEHWGEGLYLLID